MRFILSRRIVTVMSVSANATMLQAGSFEYFRESGRSAFLRFNIGGYFCIYEKIRCSESLNWNRASTMLFPEVAKTLKTLVQSWDVESEKICINIAALTLIVFWSNPDLVQKVLVVIQCSLTISSSTLARHAGVRRYKFIKVVSVVLEVWLNMSCCSLDDSRLCAIQKMWWSVT